MEFVFAQMTTGLASAASVFLVASGLSLVFGVTRIVNFAHGAFYMLGVYLACALATRLDGAFGFWFSVVAAATIVATLGALLEMTLLRRIYQAPELFQLLATFGVTLAVEDAVVLIWGPEDIIGPRAPGLGGGVAMFGQRIPAYDLLLIAIAPLALAGLWLLLRRTRFGVLARAATQDREMVAALGVNQKWLFTGVFALGAFLAGLGGALQIPRDAASHAMDLPIIVEAFVVVVIGGLGSIFGAFVAAILVSELNAFGILVLPKISLALAFLVMAAVLIVRPYGLFGRPLAAARAPVAVAARPWRPLDARGRAAFVTAIGVAAFAPLLLGGYGLSVASETLIFVLFAASLHLMMSVGGLASFGHAAGFGLGAYGAALAVKWAGLPMALALPAGPILALLGAALIGWFAVSLSGVYFAMLTLALAQIVWSIAYQWVAVTGGDNGLLGVWPAASIASPARFYWLTLAIVASLLAILRVVVFSPFGYALRAARDNELRAEAIGVDCRAVRRRSVALAGGVAGAAGALFAFLKGSVFPDVLGIPASVDALTMTLLGGVETISGPIVGAAIYKPLSIWLVSHIDQSKLALGLIIVALVALFPKGVVGALVDWRAERGA